jgi:hypothetical protein
VGRQTGYKDLEMSGQLRRSIIIGVSKGHNVIGILKQKYGASKFYPISKHQTNKRANKKTGKKAYKLKTAYAIKTYPDTVQVSEYLEKQATDDASGDIFKLSEKEIEIVVKKQKEYFYREIGKLLK